MSDDNGPNAAQGAPATQGARWAEPVAAVDRVWTKFEIWLAIVVFVLEGTSMCLWVGLKGFSTPPEHAGAFVFRGLVGGTILGVIAWNVLKDKPSNIRQGATTGAVFLGFVLAKAWLGLGVDYASNVLNWYQQASFLTLLGGLRGVGTRLTMLLALVGGSLATGLGRHIVIDILIRFVNAKQRLLMVLVGWSASAIVCFIAAWGFFDHISIENFEANADATAGAKIEQVWQQLGEDSFIARKQLALDLKSTPHVLGGATYSEWLTGKEWNAWLDDEGFVERYGKQATDGLKIGETDTRSPTIVIPGRGEPRGELINAAYLVFPIGLTIIGLRFIMRCLLVLSGHASTEHDESDEYGEYTRPGEEPVREE
jgi:TRAP-type C4-dicarboxylate transport system permease small subunit